MKKIIVIVFALCVSASLTSCTDANASTIGIEMEDTAFMHDLEVVYASSCDYLNVVYDKSTSLSEKVEVIRKADLKDESGDVIPEMPEYDAIAKYIWPNGYGEE